MIKDSGERTRFDTGAVRDMHTGKGRTVGTAISDILDYVEYDPRRILEDLREAAERAVREKRITPSERYKILQTFEDGLRGYTYFER